MQNVYCFYILSLKTSLSSQGVEYNRVLLAIEEENTLEKSLKETECEKYQCHSNKVYLIIGKVPIIDSKKFGSQFKLSNHLVI